MNTALLRRKKKYIPMAARGEVSQRQAAALIGITQMSVWRLKERWLKHGDAVWTHGNTGRRPKNKKYDREKLIRDYRKFEGTTFAGFKDGCRKYLGYDPSYTTIYKTLTAAGIPSPVPHPRTGRKHKPRKERAHTGELVQIDASRHDWLLDGRKVTLHGAIDDATHEVVALHFCENECLLGYYQVLEQIKVRKNGFPKAIYSDRSSCFFVTKRGRDKMTLEEQLAGKTEHKTQWQETCGRLGIELIAAYSPQAKGRIERLWQTLQGRLPFIFRFLKIDTVEKANAFLSDFIDGFNARFAVPPQEAEAEWREPPEVDYSVIFSVRAEKRSDSRGRFVHHGFRFKIPAPRTQFTLCLSESGGIRAKAGGRWLPVALDEPLVDVVGSPMPEVEKELVRRCLLADAHSPPAAVV